MTIPVIQGTRLSEALRDLRYELVPVSALHEEVQALPDGAQVTITSSPKMGIARTVEATIELAERGYRVIPHLAARQVRNTNQLGEIVNQLADAGVDDVMVLAGDATSPAGTMSSSLDLLRGLESLGNPFRHIGIAGYPEGHPHISGYQLQQALHEKAPYATYIVSQLCFSADAIEQWLTAIRSDGIALPVYPGIPGKVSQKRLLTMASKVGVGDSLRFLKRNTGTMLRMMFSSEFDPENLLRDLEPLLAPNYGVAGFHVYTFNAVTATEQWRHELLERLAA